MRKLKKVVLFIFFFSVLLSSVTFAKEKDIVYSDDLFVNIYAYNKIFSPNNDGLFDELILAFTPLKNKEDMNVKKWNLDIINEQTKEVVFNISGKKNLPERIVWNGYLSDGTIKEGSYKYEFTAQINKKNIKLEEDKIIVDITSPFISLSSSSDIAILSDENRFIKPIIFNLSIGDESTLDASRSKLQIFNSYKKMVKEWIFQTYNDIPSNVVWDGKDDVYLTLIPADEYEIVLTACDIVNNKDKISKRLTVLEPIRGDIKDIKIREEERGLEVSLPNKILFASGSSSLKRDAKKALEDVLRFLKSYSTNKILIEGHIDSSEKNSTNKKLSSDRAKSVFDFLIQHGIKADRLQTVACEDTKPVSFDNTSAGRAANRRVTIVVLKNDN